MELKDVSPEQRERINACDSPEAIMALAKEEGYELSESEVDQISGGAWSEYGVTCPECKKVIKLSSNESQDVTCPSCGHNFCLILSK